MDPVGLLPDEIIIMVGFFIECHDDWLNYLCTCKRIAWARPKRRPIRTYHIRNGMAWFSTMSGTSTVNLLTKRGMIGRFNLDVSVNIMCFNMYLYKLSESVYAVHFCDPRMYGYFCACTSPMFYSQAAGYQWMNDVRWIQQTAISHFRKPEGQ